MADFFGGLSRASADSRYVNVSGDTMTGALTITPSLTVPLVIGGTGTTSDLTLQTTSGVGATGADMHFLVGNNGATEAMTILNNGNVGIGTTGPGAKLEVDGSSATSDGVIIRGGSTASKYALNIISSLGGGQEVVRLQNTNSAGGASFLLVNDAGTNDGFGSLGTTVGAPYSGNFAFYTSGGSTKDMLFMARGDANNGHLRFYTGGSPGTERVRIQSSGNVGIGTTGPTAVLHLKAGTATASTAPLKFTSGTLLTAPEAGAIEFLTDTFYGTITTGAARKQFYIQDGTDVAVADGGTGASDAATARTNLGLIASGAGDIWVEKAGDTMTGALTISLATGNSLVVDSTTLVVDATNNRVGIGRNDPQSPFHLYTVYSGGTGQQNANYTEVYRTVAKADGNADFAMRTLFDYRGGTGNAVNGNFGAIFTSQYNAGANNNTSMVMTGFRAVGQFASNTVTGTISEIRGFQADANIRGGTCTNAYGATIWVGINPEGGADGAGTVTGNSIGLLIAGFESAIGSGTMTNRTGIAINNIGSASTHYALTTAGGIVQLASGTAAQKLLVVKGAASQSAHITEWQDSAANLLMSVSENGYLKIKKTTVPADGELDANELVMWWDQTNSLVAWKGKIADGTVKTGTLALA